MQLITYAGGAMALVVNGDLVVFQRDLEARGRGDPLLRFVAAMCRLAMGLELGLADGPYDDERAEGCARELLMPEGEFAALAWLPNQYLATCFVVPTEQIEPRRLELAVRPAAPN
jgi:hypothetical protein